MGRKRVKPPANESVEDRNRRLEEFIEVNSSSSLVDNISDRWIFTYRATLFLQRQMRARVKSGEVI